LTMLGGKGSAMLRTGAAVVTRAAGRSPSCRDPKPVGQGSYV